MDIGRNVEKTHKRKINKTWHNLIQLKSEYGIELNINSDINYNEGN